MIQKAKSKVVSKPQKSTTSKKISENEIFALVQNKAFELWEKAGKPFGNDWSFWFQAEQEVRKNLK